MVFNDEEVSQKIEDKRFFMYIIERESERKRKRSLNRKEIHYVIKNHVSSTFSVKKLHKKFENNYFPAT